MTRMCHSEEGPVPADPEAQASYYLGLGIRMEILGNYAAAVHWYSKGASLVPVNDDVRYFLNNNLGYSLNQLGQFAEAERYCRTAIGVEGLRYNAYKNLGVSLTGQKHYDEASDCFIKAVRAWPCDRRALLCLEALVVERPELMSRVSSLRDDLNDCRELVQRATSPAGSG